MLTWLAGLAFVAAVALSLRWYAVGRRDALGRVIPFPRISVVLLLVLSVVAAYPAFARHREERKLASAASVISGAKVKVVCQTLSGAFVDAGAEAGYVRWGPDGVPEHIAHIKWEQCKELRRYLHSDKRQPSFAQLVAVHVLTHEAVHTSGEKSESRTECKAVQRDAETARLLGAPEDGAKRLAWLYWKTVYPNMPDDYRDAACAPGGGLDEALPTSPWLAGP
jgi:hypothetical protein